MNKDFFWILIIFVIICIFPTGEHMSQSPQRIKCQNCKTTGEIPNEYQAKFTLKPCPICKGKGWLFDNEFPAKEQAKPQEMLQNKDFS